MDAALRQLPCSLTARQTRADHVYFQHASFLSISAQNGRSSSGSSFLVVFFAVDFFAAVFFAVGFFAAVFLAAGFSAVFFAAGFFAAFFSSACFWAASAAASALDSAVAASPEAVGAAAIAALILRQEVGAFGIDAERLHRALAGALEHRLAADRAVLIRRHVPGHEAAGRAALTGVIGIAALALALEDGAAALRAAARHFFRDGLRELALRIAGTGEEFAEPARLHDQIAAADLALLLGDLIRHLEPGILERLLGVEHLLMEIGIELLQHVFPAALYRPRPGRAAFPCRR